MLANRPRRPWSRPAIFFARSIRPHGGLFKHMIRRSCRGVEPVSPMRLLVVFDADPLIAFHRFLALLHRPIEAARLSGAAGAVFHLGAITAFLLRRGRERTCEQRAESGGCDDRGTHFSLSIRKALCKKSRPAPLTKRHAFCLIAEGAQRVGWEPTPRSRVRKQLVVKHFNFMRGIP